MCALPSGLGVAHLAQRGGGSGPALARTLLAGIQTCDAQQDRRRFHGPRHARRIHRQQRRHVRGPASQTRSDPCGDHPAQVYDLAAPLPLGQMLQHLQQGHAAIAQDHLEHPPGDGVVAALALLLLARGLLECWLPHPKAKVVQAAVEPGGWPWPLPLEVQAPAALEEVAAQAQGEVAAVSEASWLHFTGAPVPNAATPREDARTLAATYDFYGQRHNEFCECTNNARLATWGGWPIPGPTVMHSCMHHVLGRANAHRAPPEVEVGRASQS
ncbi:hypothetical protein N9L68_05195 [bacterium]|nr:hypothetical protein [bacterium]